MKSGVKNIIIITLSVLLVVIYMVTGTYSVIINVVQNDGINEIVNEIKVRDLLTTEAGDYNEYYYDIKRELMLTEEEVILLMNSDAMNERLQDVLNNIVDVKVNNGTKYSDDQIYNLIVEAVKRTDGLSDSLKNRIIEKSYQYKKDISKYLYDIGVNVQVDG